MIKNLAKSWNDVTLEQFIKMQNIIISEDRLLAGYDNTIHVASILMNVEVEELEKLSILRLAEIADQLKFITDEIKAEKFDIKMKSIEEITYDNFVSYTQYQNDIYNNFHRFIKDFSHTKLSLNEINSLSITKVMYCFFLSNRRLKKSLKRLKYKLIIKKLTKHLQILLKKIILLKKKFIKNLAGIFLRKK